MGLPLTSKELPPTRKDFVERFTEVRGGLRDLAPDLFSILVVALLDLFFEQLLQVAVAEAFLSLARVIDHHVGDERAGEAASLERRILGEEWICGPAARG